MHHRVSSQGLETGYFEEDGFIVVVSEGVEVYKFPADRRKNSSNWSWFKVIGILEFNFMVHSISHVYSLLSSAHQTITTIHNPHFLRFGE